MAIFNTTSSVFGASIYGQLPAGTAPLGSVAALQGTNPWAVVTPAGSVQSTTNPAGSITAVSATAPAGSVIATAQVAGSIMATSAVQPAGSLMTVITPAGSVQAVIFGNSSLVGTYAEDSAASDADKGLFVLGVRNDTVASLVTADKDYSEFAVDAIGRTIIKPFAGENATVISYFGSVVSASVTLIQASAVGKKSYMTDFMIANTGSVAQLITFQDGSTSILGFTIAPATGGSNAVGMAFPLKTNTSQDLAFKTTGTSSTVYVTVKGYQAE